MDKNYNSAIKVNPVSIKDVQDLFVESKRPGKSKAAQMISLCRDALSKKEHQILSVDEFCAYYGI